MEEAASEEVAEVASVIEVDSEVAVVLPEDSVVQAEVSNKINQSDFELAQA